jgi:hypothetical protein
VNDVTGRDARGQGLRERFRIEYRQTVTTPSGNRFVVSASPRTLGGEPDQWPLPWPMLAWAGIRQLVLIVRRQPRWRVAITPAWEPQNARIVATGSKLYAFQRADAEAAALARHRT